jgi:hypothetical protein
VDASGVKWRVRLKPAVQRSAPKTRTSRKAFSTNTPFCVRRACRFVTPGDEVRPWEQLNGNVHLEVNAPGTRPLGSFGPAIRTKNAHACFGFDRALQQGILANLIGISQGEPFLSNYTEPKQIEVHPQMGGPPGERAVVMVRERYGAIGLKHAWTVDELRPGHIAC